MPANRDIPLHPDHRIRTLRHFVHHNALAAADLHNEARHGPSGLQAAHLIVGVTALIWLATTAHNPASPLDTVLGNSSATLSVVEASLLHGAARSTPIASTEEHTPPPVSTASPDPLPHAAIGVYLTGNSIARGDKFFLETLNNIASFPSPTLVIDVKESEVFYNSSSQRAEEIGSINARYNLPEVVAQAKERGIYTIARFVAAKDRALASKRSDTHIRHPQTGNSVGSVWVDPSHPFVLEYNRELLEEVIAAGVNEVNIDYIRYPTEYPLNAVGLTTEEKADRVEKFLLMARNTIDTINPNVKLGISTYAILGWEYPINLERLGQDVVRFAPLVDIISPMAYPASFAQGYYYTGETKRSRMYELVYKTLKGYQELLKDDAWKLRPWVQGYRVTSKEMHDEIDAVYDAGLCGFMVWSPSNQYWPLWSLKDEIQLPNGCLD
jgi:hypothetical protein